MTNQGETDMKDDDGWIEWHGGECPVPDGVPIGLLFRDGDVLEEVMSDGWRWSHEGLKADIVAYRIAEPAEPTKKDGWIEWHGGACPVLAETLVDVLFRDGDEYRRVTAAGDIVAYRISKPAEPPAPDTSAEENRLWHGYAGQAMLGLMDAAMSGEEIARYAADMADAMLAEAKKRGRV